MAPSEGVDVPGAKVGTAGAEGVAEVDEDEVGAGLDDGVDGLPLHPTIAKATVVANVIAPGNCFIVSF